MKILGLDLGDQWVGTAISDELGMFARPYKTVQLHELDNFLKTTIAEHNISTIIVGYPRTMRGTESDQTKKVREKKEELEKQYPAITWMLWDERLTSKQADKLKKAKTKEEKIESHSIAAAFILSSYLDHRAFIGESTVP